MSEPTTPRGQAIVDASRVIGRAAEHAGIAYERGEDLRCSNEERAETEARAELRRLVCEWEQEAATAAAFVERAQAQTAEAIRAANALADQRDQARSELARVTAERDAAIASRDEWRGVAEEAARLVQASYFAESHLDMVSTGRSLVAWSMRVVPIAEPDPLDKGPLDHGRSSDVNEEPAS